MRSRSMRRRIRRLDGTGTIGWHYNIDDGALDFLGADDVVTLTYTVQVDDGHGGTPDAGRDHHGARHRGYACDHVGDRRRRRSPRIAVLAGGEIGPENASGTMTFTDVDLSDHRDQLDRQQGAKRRRWQHSYALTTAQHDALVNAFTIDAATHSSSDRDRHDRLALQHRRRHARLPRRQRRGDADLHGAGRRRQRRGQDPGRHHHGARHRGRACDHVGDRRLRRSPRTTGVQGSGRETGPENASGTIKFTDVDLSDLETSSITGKTLSATLANGYALTTAQHDALVNAFTIDAATHSTTDGTGTIGWHYNIDDGALDFLGADDVVTLTYTVQVDGRQRRDHRQDVTITVQGTEDTPVITTGTQAATITEDNGFRAAAGRPAPEQRRGRSRSRTSTCRTSDQLDHQQEAIRRRWRTATR